MKKFANAEAIRDIENILREHSGDGLTPSEILRQLERKWPGDQSPIPRTISRYLNLNPNVRNREPNDKSSPLYGRYYWVEPDEPEPEQVEVPIKVSVPTEFMLPFDEDELEELASSGAVWRPVEGFSDYEISSGGQVKSWRTPVPRINKPKQRTSLKGADGSVVHMRVATLVANAFMVPRPEAHLLVHVDMDSTNNSVYNLAWQPEAEFRMAMLAPYIATSRDQTHCFRGHEFTEENTRRNTDNQRQCVTCYRASCIAAQNRRRARLYGWNTGPKSTEEVLLARGQITFDKMLELS